MDLTEIYEITFKISLTVILSGLIGVERQYRRKGADLKTHILVGVGSALIVLTSLHIFEQYRDVTIIDPTRMIAGVVTGIGFLCAGTIIVSGSQIIGLTSAAVLWVVTGLGIAVGAGHYSAAIIVTVVTTCTLIFVRSIEKSIGRHRKAKIVKSKLTK